MKRAAGKCLTLLSAAAVTILPLCMPVGAVPENADCTMKQIPVYRKSLSEKETVECAFFSDMPDIPYIPIERFYSVFLDGEMTVDRDGSRYTFTELTYGTTAVADAESDIFTAEDLADFISTPVFKQEGKGMVMSGPDSLVTTDDVQYSSTAAPTSIDFKKYNIDLREENGVLYFPFATVSDLFSNADVLTAYYSGKKIYFVAMYDEINGGNARTDSPDHIQFLNSSTRSAEAAAFNYNELCFAVDTFYGFPCSYSDFSDHLALNGLDSAIEAFDPEVKRLLLSESCGEYLAGLYRLFGILLADGGHTGIELNDVFENTAYVRNIDSSFWTYSHISNEGDGYYIAKMNNMENTVETLSDLRQNTLGGEGYYTSGNTAIICFDSFYVDYDGWEPYFNGTADMPQDTIGMVYQGLEKAKSDPDIKNVIFDISQNGGGDTIALQAVIGMVTGKKSYNFYNTLGRQYLTESLVSDRNLDGTIDSLDDAVSYDDLHFAVLTSNYSFSCANIMASEMKDAGIPLIGERSGGGTCAVLLKATSDGLCYHLSAYMQYVNADKQRVDDGVPADIELVSGSGQKDYSGYYDIGALGGRLDEYYAGKSQHVSEESSEQQSSEVPFAESVVSEDKKVSEQSESASSQQASAVQENSPDAAAVVLFVIFGIAAAAMLTVTVILIVRK